MAVTTSIVVNFGDTGIDAFLSAEIVAEDNEGKTNFSAGDDVYFRIYRSGTYTVTQTAGSTSLETPNITVNIKDLNDDNIAETVTYAFSLTANTSKYIESIDSANWIGKALNEIKKVGYTELSGGKKDDIGVAIIDYNTIYDLWKLTSPSTLSGSTNYSIVIGITAVS